MGLFKHALYHAAHKKIKTRPIEYSTKSEMIATSVTVGGIFIALAVAAGGASAIGIIVAVSLVLITQWFKWSSKH
jgi:hypothetical protein